MAKIIIISSSHAKPNGIGGFSVLMHLDGRADPLPNRIIETSKTADAIAARDAMIAEAKAAGIPCAISMRLMEGRAPNGFKAQALSPFYTPVNIGE